MFPRTIIIALIILAVGIGSYLLYSQRAVQGAPAIKITPAAYDFGRLRAVSKVVSTLFTVENTGKGDLIINNMDSSCGCTTAALVVNGVEGPRFSMSGHGTNPRGWSAQLKPGEQAQLKIYYDPNAHPELRGPVTRFIMVFSNDPKNPIVRVFVSATQTD